MPFQFLDDNASTVSQPPVVPPKNIGSTAGEPQAEQLPAPKTTFKFTDNDPPQATTAASLLQQTPRAPGQAPFALLDQTVTPPSADDLQTLMQQGYKPSDQDLRTIYDGEQTSPILPKIGKGIKEGVTGILKPFVKAPGEIAADPSATRLLASAGEGIAGAAAGTVGLVTKPIRFAYNKLVTAPVQSDEQNYQDWRLNYLATHDVGATPLPTSIMDSWTKSVDGDDLPEKAIAKPYPNTSSAIGTLAALPMFEAGSELTGLNRLITNPSLNTSGKVLGAAGKTLEKVGDAAETVGGLPEQLTEKLSEKVLGEKLAGKIGKAVNVGELPVAAAAEVLGHHTVGAVLAGAKALEKAGPVINEAGQYATRLAEADPASPFGRLFSVAKDTTAPEWMRALSSSWMSKVPAALADASTTGVKSAGVGGLFGGGLSALSGDDPEEIGRNIGAGAALGVATAGLAAPALRKARILQNTMASVDNLYQAHITDGIQPDALKKVGNDAMTWAATAQQIFGDGTKIRFAPEGANSPLAKPAYGNAGYYDPNTKTAWINLDSNRDPAETVLHEIIHPIFDNGVANTPEVKQQISDALEATGQTPLQAKIRYVMSEIRGQLRGLTPDEQKLAISNRVEARDASSAQTSGDPDNWIHSELLAESAVQALYGQHPVLDVTNPSLADTLKKIALPPLQDLLTRMGVKFNITPQRGSRPATVLPGFENVIDSPPLRKLVYSLIKAQKDFMPGLSETEAQGVPISKEMWGKHPGAGLEPQANGTAANDFVVQDANGRVINRSPRQVKNIVKSRREEINALYPNTTPPVEATDTTTDIKPRKTPSGVIERGGTTLGPGFDQLKTVGPKTKAMAKQIEQAIKDGGAFSGWYQQIGKGADWKASVGKDTGAIEAQYKDFIPTSFKVDKQGNLLVQNYSLSAFQRKAASWAQRHGPTSLDLWGGDIGHFGKDVQQYLENHASNLPGEANNLGVEKKNVINGFLVGGNRAFADKNPLRPSLKGEDRQGIVRSYRLDRLETLEPLQSDFQQPQYNKQVQNLSPNTPTVDDVSKLNPTEFFDKASEWRTESMKQEHGLTLQQIAETAAQQNPNRAQWEAAAESARTDARRIRDEVLAKPESMMERQKELMGSAQKSQFFQEALKVIPAPKLSPDTFAKEIAKIPAAKASELPTDNGDYWMTRDGKFISVAQHQQLADQLGVSNTDPLYHSGLVRVVVRQDPWNEGKQKVWMNGMQDPIDFTPKQQQAVSALQDREFNVDAGASKLRDNIPGALSPDVALTDAGKALEKQGYSFQTRGEDNSDKGQPHLYVALHNDKGYVGSIQARLPDKDQGIHTSNALIDSVKVDPKYRNQGLSEVLYRELATRLQKKGITDMTGFVVHPAPLKVRDKLFGKPLEKETVEGSGPVGGHPTTYVTHALNADMKFSPPVDPDQEHIASAAVQDNKGKVWTGSWHGEAIENARKDRPDLDANGSDTVDGFTTSTGRFVDRDEALKIALAAKQLGNPKSAEKERVYGDARKMQNLESQRFDNQRLFSPPVPGDSKEQISAPAARWNKTGKVYTGVVHSDAMENAFQSGEIDPKVATFEDLNNLTPAAAAKIENGFSHGFLTTKGRFVSRDQAARIAKRAGQLSRDPSFDLSANGKPGLDSMDIADEDYMPQQPPALPQLSPPPPTMGDWDRKMEEQATRGTKKPKAAPRVGKQWELKSGGTSGFSKAWIQPNGLPIQLGATWHHQGLNDRPDLLKKYGINRSESSEDNRIEALGKGFARINYDTSSGRLTVEARQKDWDNLKPSIINLVKANGGKIDHMEVNLFDRRVKRVVDSGDMKMFDLNNADKADSIPLISAPSDTVEFSPQASAFTQLSPDTNRKPNEEVRANAAAYMKLKDLPYVPHEGYTPIDEQYSRATADFYQNAVHNPNDPAVQAAYRAFGHETVDQWKHLVEKGLDFEPWTKAGQPYANSAEMTKDVRDNHHLWYFPTTSGFGTVDAADHPLLGPSGIVHEGKDLPLNDIFRAVHDYYGHAKEGYEFGPRGEYNAFQAHSAMYSDLARGAMGMETHGQNSWVNFGPHMRDAQDNLLQKGEPGYLPITQRPYAEQKANVLPQDLQKLSPNIDDAAEQVAKFTKETGGASYNITDGKLIGKDKAFGVSLYPERSVILDPDKVTPDELKKFIVSNADLLAKPGHAIGTWLDKSTGKVYVDVTIGTPDRKFTLYAGQQTNQKAIWDSEKGREINTGGTGEPVKNIPPVETRFEDLQKSFKHDNEAPRSAFDSRYKKQGMMSPDLDKIPQEGEHYEIVPKGENPLNTDRGHGKYYVTPDLRWIAADEHDDAAQEILGRNDPHVKAYKKAKDMGPGNSAAQLDYNWTRVIDDGDTLYIESSNKPTAKQIKEIKDVGIENKKIVMRADYHAQETLYDPKDAGTYSPDTDKTETTEEWLARHEVRSDGKGKFLFYHATPKKGGATTSLRPGTLLAKTREKAKVFAARDRDLKDGDIKVFRLWLSPDEIQPGVHPSLKVAHKLKTGEK